MRGLEFLTKVLAPKGYFSARWAVLADRYKWSYGTPRNWGYNHHFCGVITLLATGRGLHLVDISLEGISWDISILLEV